MKTVTPYLFFSGTCKEAMEFYAESLAGEITIMQTCKEAPIDFPSDADENIFNSELRAGDVCIKASDNPDLSSATGQATFSLFVSFSEKSEFEDVSTKLSEGGNIGMKSGDQFVMLSDKFGVSWMLVLMTE